MSSAAIQNTNKACCTLPPVQSDYTAKGYFEAYGGFDRVYVTGPKTSDKVVVCIYDIFGYFPQTKQGADMIAESMQARVLIPDFFEPEEAWPAEPFPPVTESERKRLGEFFNTTAGQDKANKKLKKLGETLKGDNARKIAVYGLCWGSKVAINVSGETSLFDAIAMIHPALVVVDDAKQIKVPFAMYPSKNESEDDYNQIIKLLEDSPHVSKNDYKYYKNMSHGWAGARGNLKDEETSKDFHEVYTRLVQFFCNAFE